MNEHVTALAPAEGLGFDLDSYTVVNTFDAHRLTHLAKVHGLGAELHERLLRAQLVEGEVLDEPATLVRLGVEVRLPEASARDVLAGDDHASDVRYAAGAGLSGLPRPEVVRSSAIPNRTDMRPSTAR